MMKTISSIAFRSIRSTGRNSFAAITPLVSRNVVRISPIQNSFHMLLMRGFASKGSSIVSKDEDEIPTLADSLATEIAEEVSEDSVDQELEDIKAEIKKTFTIKDEVGHGVVHLHASLKGTKIHVTFDCQDEADTGFDMNELQMPPQGSDKMSENDEEVPSIDFGINFTARIIHPNGDKIVLDCIASQSLQILNMQHVPAGKEEEDGELYGGPVFEQLSESLQDSVYDYLEDHKISDDLCFFILSYSRFKEQAEYTNWLNSMLATVDKHN